jgi:integrase
MAKGNRESSIYKRADGRWTAQVALPGDSRIKRRRKYLYGKSREDVRRKQVEAQKALQDVGHIAPERLTVSAYMRSWLEHRKHELSWQTWRRYEQLFRAHIEPTLGSVRINRLRPDQLRDLYSSKLSEGLAAETVRHIHKVIRAALNQAEREDLVVKNVCRQVKPPRKQRYEINPLSPDETRTLRETMRGHPDEALYVLALSTGMRQGEILGLRWRDCNLDNGYISVNRSLVFVVNDWYLQEPKTASSRRRIQLANEAVDAFGPHLRSQLEKRMALGEAWQDNDLVFPTDIGTPRRGANLVYRSFRPLLERAGIRRIRFHDLRHTAATLLLGEGVHPKVVSEMLGHSSVQLTLDTYSHVTPTMQQEAATKMNDILSG